MCAAQVQHIHDGLSKSLSLHDILEGQTWHHDDSMPYQDRKILDSLLQPHHKAASSLPSNETQKAPVLSPGSYVVEQVERVKTNGARLPTEDNKGWVQL